MEIVLAIFRSALIEVSPYKGLKRFEANDRELFFGRDQLIRSLVTDLETNNLILLLGASGSGKSSAVRAGLTPRLKQTWGSQFLPIFFTPDRDPFESLYASLLQTFKQDEAKVARPADYKTLIQTVKTLKPTNQQWLILIDQFEELFTLTPPSKRAVFIKALLALNSALQHAGWHSVKLILTMRADFLDRISAYPNLGRLLQGHIQLVTDMHPDELRLAIEQPAAHNGVVFEEGLVEEIIKDVQGQAGSLPLLQYTLDLLWQRDDIRDRTLNTQTYRELGGVRGALQRRVDTIYRSFNPEERIEVKQIFLKLVDVVGSIEEVDLAGRAVSKRVSLMSFEDQHERQILQRLVDYNLLVSNDRRQSTDDNFFIVSKEQYSTVEIAHEALLSSWKTLQTWIDESKEVIIINNRLRDDSIRWRQLLNNDPAAAEEELWSGTKLDRALELQQQKLFEITLGGLTEDEKAFLQSSVDRQQRLRQEAEARRQRELNLTRNALEQEKRAAAEAKKAQAQERKARKATQKFAIAIIVLLVAVVGGSGLIGWQRQQQRYAQQQQRYAQLVADVAKGVINPELLPVAADILEQGRQFQQVGRIEDALSNYQVARDYAMSLQSAATENLTDDFDSVGIEELFTHSTDAIISIIRAERLPELKSYLEANEIGKPRESGDVTDLENRYEVGALRSTYIVAIRDTGADLDDDGILSGPEETDRIPCPILQDIEEAWRELTNNDCGWFGPPDEFEDSLNRFNPNCNQLNESTLSAEIFVQQTYIGENRLIQCGIGEV
ncbi:MAG: ATP-binding protein [Thainema sp.]